MSPTSADPMTAARPAADRSLHDDPEFRIIMGSFTVGLPEDADIAAFTQKTALEWMARRARAELALPDDPADQARLEGEGGTVEWVGTDRTWAARLSQRDQTAFGKRHNRVWTVEVAVRKEEDGRHSFSYRMHCANPGRAERVRNVPSIVREVSSELGIFDGGQELLPEAVLVSNKVELDEFVQHLESPARARSVIVLSADKVDADGQPVLPFDADEFADRVFSLYHVYVLTPLAADALSRLYGPDFDVRRGSVRSYRPGFDPMADHPKDHPAASLRTIHFWEGGPEGFADYLAQDAFRTSVRNGQAWMEFPTVDYVAYVEKQALQAAPGPR